MRISIALALLVVSIGAAADPKYPIKTFTWENDDVFLSGGVDRYYTNGLRLTLIGKPDEKSTWPTTFADTYCALGCGARAVTTGLVLGHVFFTPEKIEVVTPQPFDRPFAGWLFVGKSLQITEGARQHSFEATIGVLGPAAGAATLQTAWHDLPFVNGRPPRGWHNQLKNEPTLQLNYQQSRRYGSSSLDVVPQIGAAAGTIQTFASAGFVARAGKNITGFPITIIPTTLDVDGSKRPTLEGYVFIGAESRFVLHNAFLDGGFFRGGPSVNRENVVNDIRVGASGRYRSLRLTYTFVRRSTEFTPASPRGGSHRFASISLSVERELQF